MIRLLDSLSREDRTLAELELTSREGALVVIARELEVRRRLLDAAERRFIARGVKPPGEVTKRGQEPLEQKVLRESLVSPCSMRRATSNLLCSPHRPTAPPHHHTRSSLSSASGACCACPRRRSARQSARGGGGSHGPRLARGVSANPQSQRALRFSPPLLIKRAPFDVFFAFVCFGFRAAGPSSPGASV